MSNKVKNVNIKKRSYYFINDIINIKDFNPNNSKIDEKSYKNTLNYHSGYVMIKDSKYIKLYSVNNLYLTFRYVTGQINGN